MGRSDGPGEETAYLVLWWLDQTLYVARFGDEAEAEAAARVRNGAMIQIKGRDVSVPRVVDYYRRDDTGNPMPGHWRDLGGERKKAPAFVAGTLV